MTLYSVSYFCGEEEFPCALFSDATPEEVITTFCDDMHNAIDECDRVCAVNMETGVILYDVCSFGYNPDLEPADIDDDCGFDPYMGCYTDDC